MPQSDGTGADACEHLELKLLGGTQLTDGPKDGGRSVLTSGKPLALLTFLHCAPARSASREQLLELLWSDADPESGRHTLRQTLWYIRRKLGGDPFAMTGDGIRLQVDFDSDRDRFLAALESDDAERAFHQYDGDFFPEFAAPGGAEFEHWADLERARLRALFLGAATRVVRDRLGKGHARDAIALARRTRELAPLHQAAWRLVLESNLAADDAISAAVEIERLQQWLTDDEIEPDAATTQLLKTARAGRATIAKPVGTESATLSAELVGRESEFAELLGAFDAAKRSESRHVHITAAAGHGKTRLLEGFAARLRSVKTRVITIRATTAERSLPYAFAAQLVTALVQLRGASAVSPDTARTLVSLAPTASSYLTAEPDRATGDDALRRRSLAVAELVSTIAHDAPVVLLVDDVHWMDQQSRTLLASLAARLESSSVLLVTAARSADRFVEDTPHAKRLMLSPLSVDDVGAMVMSIGQLPNDVWADELITGLHSASGGSPLLVLEALQLVMERDQLALRDGVWYTSDPAGLGSTLSAGRAMQQRLSSLPAGARDALLRLSIAGTAVDDTMMAHILSQDGQESLAMLETRGLVVHSDEQWRTAHDEIAALSIEMAGKSDRMRAHAAIAEYLERDRTGTTAMLLQAAQHRARMDDTTALDRVFVRAVRSAHLSGEHQAIRHLGQEILGSNAAPADVDTLVKRLPWSVRNRPRRWTSLAVFAASLVVLAVSISLRAPAAAPTHGVTFAMIGMVDGARQLFTVDVDVADLRRNGPIEMRTDKSPVPVDSLSKYYVNYELANGDFLGQVTSGDSIAGVDLVRVNKRGQAIPYIAGRYDQSGQVVSPDAKVVAYTSGEWHPAERTEMAIFNDTLKQGKQLTHSDAREFALRWSPDGSRIAFLRSHATEHPTDVCWINIDGQNDHCVTMNPNTVAQDVIGWTTDYTVLVYVFHKKDGHRELIELDFATGAFRAIDSSGTKYFADPSGQVIVCLCRVPGLSSEVYAVFAPNDPTHKRVLQRAGNPLRAQDATLQYWAPQNTQLESIAVSTAAETAIASRDQFVVYDVTGTNIDGKERRVPNFQWSSGDTSIATIDSTGKAYFLREGTARFTVSAGGWRTYTFTVRVMAPNYKQAILEDWRLPLGRNWTTYGDPAPSVVRSDTEMLLRVNGDKHLPSGIVSRLSIDESQGAGVRVKARLPVDTAQWQNLAVALDYFATDSQVQAWQASGEELTPLSWQKDAAGRRCMMAVPKEEGGEYIDLISFQVGREEVSISRPPPRITDGKWHTITVQTFPDGRCAYAVDGVAVAISQSRIRRGKPLRVYISGQSVGTHIEVGTVEAWSGLRTDVDWSVFQRPVVSRRD